VAAWLRKGDLEAGRVRCSPYEEDAFRDAVDEARALINEQPEQWWSLIVRSFSQAGVALVLVPEVKGARASGASRWLTPHKAVIQLSLRYTWEDQFWFSLFHETCHVLKHPKKSLFVNNGDPNDPYEHEANAFAARTLIPEEFQDDLGSITLLSEVRPFARKVGVPPGVVVGRLQREKVFDYSVGNKLRRQFRMIEAERVHAGATASGRR
jgi:HTH-type transcriptional regulator/antitoxin HigA